MGTEREVVKEREAIERLLQAYHQQRRRRPMRDDEPIAVYYGDLRHLAGEDAN